MLWLTEEVVSNLPKTFVCKVIEIIQEATDADSERGTGCGQLYRSCDIEVAFRPQYSLLQECLT